MQNITTTNKVEKQNFYRQFSKSVSSEETRMGVAQTAGSASSLSDEAKDQIALVREYYEDRIRLQEEHNQEIIREMDAFSHSIAHDLRAPLRAAAMMAERLTTETDWVLPPEAIRSAERIQQSVGRMQMLIEKLLEFSRTSGIPQHRVEVDMTEMVRTVLDELLQSDSGPSLTVFIEPLHPTNADPSMIRQVWFNLLSNSLKYTATRASRQVKITSRTGGREVVYRVSDNGVGFDMKYADKLFGLFQRLHGEEEFEGTGVGLAIVQRIIQRHGGRVWAESVEDNGASFFFSLPL